MEHPVRPDERRARPREPELEPEPGPEPEADPRKLSAVFFHPLLGSVALILILSFTCTVARLVLVIQLHKFWARGLPTLCSGAITSIPYGSLDVETAFTFEAISNALATQIDDNDNMCHTPNYSLGLSKGLMASINACLIAVGVFDMIGTDLVLGRLWWSLFLDGRKLRSFRCALAWVVVALGLDATAIYYSSRTERPAILGLSVVIIMGLAKQGQSIQEWWRHPGYSRTPVYDVLQRRSTSTEPAPSSTGEVPQMRMFNAGSD
ncbi:hypothetical protein LTR93_009257 [Exophiala xenobiotica]|nr:hypothetical protein LTR93_009257 [Exophiala xenobiotica]KAK5412316.1 hypothetical protein LTR06_005286 [Exophiala xenobiotica]